MSECELLLLRVSRLSVSRSQCVRRLLEPAATPRLPLVRRSIPAMELRVGNKYRLGRKIGSGSFGDIYLGM